MHWHKQVNITAAAAIQVFFLMLYYAWVSPFFLYHNDIGWHLATGDLIRARGSIPVTDPWAYTSGGWPWINLSWLWDVLASALYAKSGAMGLLALTACVGVATLALLGDVARRLGGRPPLVLALCLYIGVVFPFYEPPDIFLAAAPQQATLLFCAATLGLLQRVQQQFSRWQAAMVAGLFALWANMHGGFLAGYAMLALMALAALAQGQRLLARRCAMLLAVAVAATLANPYSTDVFEGVRGTLGHIFQQDVSEWQPLYKQGISLVFLSPSLLYTAVFLLALAPWRRWRQADPFAWMLLAVSLLLLAKGVLVLRYFSLFLLVSLPATAWGLSQLLPHATQDEPRMRHPLPALLVAAVLALGVMQGRNPAPIRMPTERDPEAEIAYILQQHPQARIINHWNYGSFLIFHAGGRLQPFIDGRMGTAYPDAVFSDLQALYASGDWGALLDKYHAQVVLWPRGDDRILAWFEGRSDWHEAFRGELAVVLVKN